MIWRVRLMASSYSAVATRRSGAADGALSVGKPAIVLAQDREPRALAGPRSEDR